MRHSDWRVSVLSDVPFIAHHLREADKQEIAAHSGETPVTALFRSFMDSVPCNTIIDPDGVPVGLFGVAPTHDPLVGACWAVMTDHIQDIRYDFIRRSRVTINKLNQQWPILHNWVDQRNTLHIKWLHRMGFSFLRVIPCFGVEQRPFIEFVRIAGVH